MIDKLFEIGSFEISPFGVMLVVAFLASFFQLRWGLERLGAGDDDDASAILLAAGLGGIVGAKVYYAVLYGDWRLLFDRSGLVWYGGFALGAAAVILVMRLRRLPAWPTADATAPALALGYALGRIGCFLVGDDYGVPTGGPFGVVFPVGVPLPTAANLRAMGAEVPPGVAPDALLPVHPTQLYEAALALAIWAVGIWLLRRRPAPGTTTLAVVALLAVERFAIEFLRAKDDRFLGEFTVAQAISVGVLLLVAVLAWLRRGGAAASAGAAASPPRPSASR
jgi:phosphatidylglycerol:prolipoprotein diacylglycerol transferase